MRFERLVADLEGGGLRHPLDPEQAWRLDKGAAAPLLAAARAAARAELPKRFDGGRLAPELLGGTAARLDELLEALDGCRRGARDVDWAKLRREGGLILEPMLARALMLLAPAGLEEAGRYDLVRLLKRLEAAGLSPFDDAHGLTARQFESPDGWKDRSPLSACLRRVVAYRISEAHLSPATSVEETIQAANAALACVLGLVRHNQDALRILLESGPVNLLYWSLAGGVPARVQVPSSRLRYESTRAEMRLGFANALQAAATGPRGQHFEVLGPPGWGKTEFIAGALQELAVPVHWVGLDLVLDERWLATQLLEGVDADEFAAHIDRKPIVATSVLLRDKPPPLLVAFENVSSLPPKVASALPVFIAELTKRGAVVVTDPWTHRVGLAPHDRTELPSLDAEEVAAWGRARLQRELEASEELGGMALLAGYPGLIDAALRELRLAFPERPPQRGEADGLFLQLCEQPPVDLDALLDVALSAVDGRTAGLGGLGEWERMLLQCFALLPWTDLPLPSPDLRSAARRLVALSLARSDADLMSVQGAPAGRLLGLKWLVAGRVHPSALELAQAAAPATSAEVCRRSARHLAALALRHAWPEVAELTHLLSEQAPTGNELRAYEAPLQVPENAHGLAELLSPAAKRELAIGTARTMGREADLALLLEGADDWRVIKALHTIAIDIDLERRIPLYRAVGERLRELPSETNAHRVWAARVLCAGSGAAVEAGDREMAVRWLSEAEARLGAVSNHGPDRWSRILNLDTHYRLAAARLPLARSLADLQRAHWRALHSVPDEMLQSEQWFARWGRHVVQLIRLTGWSEDWRQLLDEGVSNGPVRGAARLLVRILRATREEAAGVNWVSQTAEQLLGRAELSEVGLPTTQQLRLLSGDETQIQVVAAEVEDQMGQRLVEGQLFAEDFWVLEALFVALEPIPVHGLPGRSRLRKLADVALEAELDDSSRQLTRLALAFAWRHEVKSVVDKVKERRDEGIVDREWPRALVRGVSRVRVLYRKLLPARPWLARAWTTLEIGTSGIALSCARNSVVPGPHAYGVLSSVLIEGEAVAGGFLAEFDDLVDEIVDEPGIRAYCRYSLHRYLWDWDAAVVQLEAMMDSPMHVGGDSLWSLRDMMGLVPAILTEDALRTEQTISREGQARLRQLFLRLAEDLPRLGASHSSMLVQTVASVLRAPEDPLPWRELAKYWHGVLGAPREYWAHFSDGENDAAAAPAPSLIGAADLTADLTDSAALKTLSWIARYASCLSELPFDLRLEFAEIAVAAAFGAERWNATSSGGSSMGDRFNIGVAVSLALDLSTNGRIFDTPYAPIKRRDSQKKPWREFALDCLGVQGVGRFGAYSRELAKVLRGRLKLSGSSRVGR